MDPNQIQQALVSQQNPKKAEEESKKQAEIEEKRKVYLQSFMTKEALERCKCDK